jgi:hypothetical protein
MPTAQRTRERISPGRSADASLTGATATLVVVELSTERVLDSDEALAVVCSLADGTSAAAEYRFETRAIRRGIALRK